MLCQQHSFGEVAEQTLNSGIPKVGWDGLWRVDQDTHQALPIQEEDVEMRGMMPVCAHMKNTGQRNVEATFQGQFPSSD